MKATNHKAILCISFLLISSLFLPGCNVSVKLDSPKEQSVIEYSDDVYPLERNGIKLYLDRISVKGEDPEKNILLVHGVTYSSHEFDVNYLDYSLSRALAREGYAVWRLDKSGNVHVFNDIDIDPTTITCNINIEGYSFELIYKD